eukprot:gene10775-biopygen7831
MDEVRAACRLRKDLERIVHDAMSEHLVYETDNSCGAIVGVTADAMAAVQCSLDVKKAVSELNPRDYAAPVALDSDSSCAAGGSRRARHRHPRRAGDGPVHA